MVDAARPRGRVHARRARLFGRGPAFAATAPLAVNVVIAWFARYPNAEVVMLALLPAALLAAARVMILGTATARSVRWPDGLLVLLLFLRVDAVIGVAAIALAATLAHTQGHRIGWAFWLVLGAGVALWWPDLTGPMAGYAHYPLAFVRNEGAIYFAGLGIVAVVAIPADSRRQPALVADTPRDGAGDGRGVRVPLGVYAFFFRVASGRLALHDAESLRT